MQSSPYLLPHPVGSLLSHLPAYPGSALFVIGLNLALRPKLPADVTHMLEGKKLRLRVIDAQWVLDFEWCKDRFVVCSNAGVADLTISASAYDFMLLARRQEDPDTLFFSRRLAMEGDTELALLVKNAMDAIELPVLNLASFKPQAVLAQVRERVSAGLAHFRSR